jgi:hypothetical protein
MMRKRSSAVRGLTLVELLIGAVLGLVVVIAASGLHLGVERSFKWGARKLLAQREASLLSSTITRRVRAAARYTIHRLPDRVTPVDAGDCLALWDADGVLLGRLEWSDSLQTVVDATGAPVTSMKVQDLQFRRLPALPPLVLYRAKVDDEKGSRVDIETGAFVRNGAN